MEDVLKRLSADEIELLKSAEVSFAIPPEFSLDDNEKVRHGTILSPRPDAFGNTLIRYRSDLITKIATPTRKSVRLESTLAKLAHLIDLDRSDLIHSMSLGKHQLLLIDNARWLHGRTKIYDLERRLLRIRFQTKDAEMLPWEMMNPLNK